MVETHGGAKARAAARPILLGWRRPHRPPPPPPTWPPRGGASCPDSPASRAVGAELLARWAEPHRRYHTLDHLRAVLAAVDRARRPTPPTPTRYGSPPGSTTRSTTAERGGTRSAAPSSPCALLPRCGVPPGRVRGGRPAGPAHRRARARARRPRRRGAVRRRPGDPRRAPRARTPPTPRRCARSTGHVPDAAFAAGRAGGAAPAARHAAAVPHARRPRAVGGAGPGEPRRRASPAGGAGAAAARRR